MIKFNGSISFMVTQRCKICGKTYEGDSNVVMRKSIVHLIFRHPKESAKIIIRYFKNRRADKWAEEESNDNTRSKSVP